MRRLYPWFHLFEGRREKLTAYSCHRRPSVSAQSLQVVIYLPYRKYPRYLLYHNAFPNSLICSQPRFLLLCHSLFPCFALLLLALDHHTPSHHPQTSPFSPRHTQLVPSNAHQQSRLPLHNHHTCQSTPKPNPSHIAASNGRTISTPIIP